MGRRNVDEGRFVCGGLEDKAQLLRIVVGKGRGGVGECVTSTVRRYPTRGGQSSVRRHGERFAGALVVHVGCSCLGVRNRVRRNPSRGGQSIWFETLLSFLGKELGASGKGSGHMEIFVSESCVMLQVEDLCEKFLPEYMGCSS